MPDRAPGWTALSVDELGRYFKNGREVAESLRQRARLESRKSLTLRPCTRQGSNLQPCDPKSDSTAGRNCQKSEGISKLETQPKWLRTG